MIWRNNQLIFCGKIRILGGNAKALVKSVETFGVFREIHMKQKLRIKLIDSIQLEYLQVENPEVIKINY